MSIPLEPHWITMKQLRAVCDPTGEFAVVAECDESKVAATVFGVMMGSTFAEANAWLNYLRNSPQWDYTVKVIEVLPKPRPTPSQAVIKELDKLAWIAKFGSDQLKMAVSYGHGCHLKYITDRRKHEGLGAYAVDFGDTMATETIDCPSVAAMEEVERVRGMRRKHRAEVVKLIYVQGADERYTYPHKEACVIRFHGTNLYRIMEDK